MHLLHFIPDGSKGILGVMDLPDRLLKGADTGSLAVDDIFYQFVLKCGNAVFFQNPGGSLAHYQGVDSLDSQQTVKVGRCLAHHLIGGGEIPQIRSFRQPADKGLDAPFRSGENGVILAQNAGIIAAQQKRFCFFQISHSLSYIICQ